jgi:endonuclease/exonuclease/phosphatase (EEP) superfamily protein YafD
MPWMGGLPDAADRAADGAGFVVAGADVHLDNTNPMPLTDWVSEHRPDVLVVLEVSDAHARAWSLGEQYPHRVVVPRADPFGIALLSRHPIRQQAVIEGEHDTPRIEAVLDWQGQEITVVAFHPMPPISVADHLQRNDLLAALAQRFTNTPTVIVGDFNATPWSSAFAVPERNGFARASSLQPTWPAAWGGVVGLPIDQVIVSRHWAVAERAVGTDIGSDHLPVAVSLSRRPE